MQQTLYANPGQFEDLTCVLPGTVPAKPEIENKA